MHALRISFSPSHSHICRVASARAEIHVPVFEAVPGIYIYINTRVEEREIGYSRRTSAAFREAIGNTYEARNKEQQRVGRIGASLPR